MLNEKDGRTCSGRFFSLDARLGAIAALVPRGARMWDVGSDHGRLPVWLVKNELVECATASDISDKPLASAKRTADRHGASLRFVLCDGLPPEAHAADVFTIAGMGGGTIAQILSAAPWTRDKLLILQPMSSAEDLRDFLYSRGYAITGEHYARDGRRGYVIITVNGGCPPRAVSLAELYAGEFITDPHYLKRCIVRLKNRLDSSTSDSEEVTHAIATIEGRIAHDNITNL